MEDSKFECFWTIAGFIFIDRPKSNVGRHPLIHPPQRDFARYLLDFRYRRAVARSTSRVSTPFNSPLLVSKVVPRRSV